MLLCVFFCCKVIARGGGVLAADCIIMLAYAILSFFNGTCLTLLMCSFVSLLPQRVAIFFQANLDGRLK